MVPIDIAGLQNFLDDFIDLATLTVEDESLREKLLVHFTPTYGSWINLVERWFAEITNKRIRRGVFRSVKDLESAIREYIDVHNEDPTPFTWAKTADQILASIARYARRTMVAHPS